MAVLRLLCWVLLTLAIALAGADGISSLEAHTLVLRSGRDVIALVGLTLGPVEGGGAATIAAFLLSVPFWALLGAAGTVLFMIVRPID